MKYKSATIHSSFLQMYFMCYIYAVTVEYMLLIRRWKAYSKAIDFPNTGSQLKTWIFKKKP